MTVQTSRAGYKGWGVCGSNTERDGPHNGPCAACWAHLRRGRWNDCCCNGRNEVCHGKSCTDIPQKGGQVHRASTQDCASALPPTWCARLQAEGGCRRCFMCAPGHRGPRSQLRHRLTIWGKIHNIENRPKLASFCRVRAVEWQRRILQIAGSNGCSNRSDGIVTTQSELTAATTTEIANIRQLNHVLTQAE